MCLYECWLMQAVFVSHAGLSTTFMLFYLSSLQNIFLERYHVAIEVSVCKKLPCIHCHRIAQWTTMLCFFISGSRWHSRAASGKFGMLRRAVCNASIVMLFGSLIMMPRAHFYFLYNVHSMRVNISYNLSLLLLARFLELCQMLKAYLYVIC